MAGLGLHDHKSSGGLPGPAKLAIAAAVACALAALAFFAVSRMPVFVVAHVEAEGSDHLTASEIQRLANVPQDATLLNVDEGAISQNLAKNPWVKSVSVTRVFPDTLRLTVQERSVFALVAMQTGSSVWYLSDGGVWIEPVQVSVRGTGTVAEAALARAAKEGCLLIQGVPSSVAPKAGAKVTDAPILGVIAYQDAFSKGFAEQVASYTASSDAAISCVLKSGLEISLGSPSQIASKEAVITELMAAHPNQLTFINVRNPSKPSYRKVQSDAVSPGSGVVTDDGADAEGTDTGEGGASSGSDGQAGLSGTQSADGSSSGQGASDGTSSDGSSEGSWEGQDGATTAAAGDATGLQDSGSSQGT